jgi:hypothetical protein
MVLHVMAAVASGERDVAELKRVAFIVIGS